MPTVYEVDNTFLQLSIQPDGLQESSMEPFRIITLEEDFPDSPNQEIINRTEKAISLGLRRVHRLDQFRRDIPLMPPTNNLFGLHLIMPDENDLCEGDDPTKPGIITTRKENNETYFTTNFVSLEDKDFYIMTGNPLHINGRRGFIVRSVLVLREDDSENQQEVPDPRNLQLV